MRSDIKKDLRGNINYTSENRYKVNNFTVFVKTRPLTARWVSGFNAAKKAIDTNNFTTGYRLGAAIYEGNRLLASASNFEVKTRPGNTAIKPDGTTYNITCHAEQIAIDRIKYKKGHSTGLIMYVVRINSKNNLVISKPCIMCIDYMRFYGIKIIRFINSSGMPEEMKLV